MKTLPTTVSLALVSLLGLSGCFGPQVVDVPSQPDGTTPKVTPVEVSPVVAPKVEVVPPALKANPTLVVFGSSWKYSSSAEGYEGDWKSGSFDDASWSNGKTPIGYGDDDMATKLDNSGDNKEKILSVRGRATFEVADPTAYGALRIRVMRDDGIVIYLNGEEIVRDNLSSGALKATSLASKAISGAAEGEYLDLPVPSGKLLAGKNVVAVAVHQNRSSSTDLWFDIELTGEVK